ncbi:hypothetical protein K505DRAFT_86454 [Melanomma pulvis-pyrius CBS 109.77]|uniref:Uncharacterized protein n=1 Tax=Melanomma pulvis-pyrius CBS 109.77 TaxID=1314802 RepID=A0A6A6X0U2_9PLEO|nr:hypothetical protein K505DRAFT_86454 [Melanomma pulvis-pyrius CBS 109.77]
MTLDFSALIYAFCSFFFCKVTYYYDLPPLRMIMLTLASILFPTAHQSVFPLYWCIQHDIQRLVIHKETTSQAV